LREWLAKLGSRRLGHYYERCGTALGQAPGIELLAANLAIATAGAPWASWTWCCATATACTTWNWRSSCTWALKAAGSTRTLAGPRLHDRLGTKLAHLAGHQLPMSKGAHSRELLATLGVEQVQAHVWLGGYLFYPLPGHAEPPTAHLRGRWVRRRDWEMAEVSIGSRCRGMPGWHRRGSKQ
jgi:hypothetical protein